MDEAVSMPAVVITVIVPITVIGLCTVILALLVLSHVGIALGRCHTHQIVWLAYKNCKFSAFLTTYDSGQP